jgi:dipeptidyl aminopeptidase/acylaminoacyl peptidase
MSGPASRPSSANDRLTPWFDVIRSFQPSVSFDGTQVLFLSDATGLPQVWRKAARGGRARPFAVGAERAGRVDASPKHPRAVVARDSGGNEVWQLELHDLTKGPREASAGVRPLTSDPKVMNIPGLWTEDGQSYLFASNSRDHRFFDVYRCDVDTASSPERIWTGDGWQMPMASRGTKTLVQRVNTFLNIDLFLLDSGTSVHLNPHTEEVSVSSAAVGLDGVYVATNPDREFLSLFRYPFDGSPPQLLREYPGDIEVVRAAPDGGTLALSVNHAGCSELHLLGPTTGEDRWVPVPHKGVVAELSWFPDGSALAYDLTWPNGHEVFVLDLRSGTSRRLTRSKVRPPERVPEPRLRVVRAEDRLKIPILELVPRGRPPRGTILAVHGGPESQARPWFDPATGYMVAEGWRVVFPNVRGSTGYGRSFVHLDDGRKRMDSVRDLRDVVRALVRSRKAVEGRVGIIGGSYGGFMVLSAITTFPELWGAAVELYGISNLVTFLERTADWRRPQREAEYGSLETDREFLASISPVHHLDRLRTPLLIFHGRNDPRVPIGEAEQVVAEVQKRGGTVELVTFENEGHGFEHRENLIETARRAAQFLDRFLEPGPSPAPERASEDSASR